MRVVDDTVDMPSTDEFRVCQAPSPTEPGKVHGIPISGQGRSKYCSPECAARAREEQRKVDNPRWAREWRERHPVKFRVGRWIDRTARRLGETLYKLHPEIKRPRIDWAVRHSLWLAFYRSAPRETTRRRFIFPVIMEGFSHFSLKPVVPCISHNFVPALQGRRDLPWIVKMMIRDEDHVSFRVNAYGKPAGPRFDDKTTWVRRRAREIIRLATALGLRQGEGAVLIGMPTLASVLGIGDFGDLGRGVLG